MKYVSYLMHILNFYYVLTYLYLLKILRYITHLLTNSPVTECLKKFCHRNKSLIIKYVQIANVVNDDSLTGYFSL